MGNAGHNSELTDEESYDETGGDNVPNDKFSE